MDKFTFVCTDGSEIKLRVASHAMMHGIDARVEREFKEADRQVNPPQYVAELVGGTEEHHDHDEKSIEGAPQEEQDRWQDYLDTCVEIETEAGKRRNLFIYREGLTLDEDEAQGGDWIVTYERYCDPVPTDPDERLLLYVETAVLKTPADQMGAVGKIMALMVDGVPEELTDIAQDMFRHSLEQQAAFDGLQAELGQEPGSVVDSAPSGNGE